jgi:hypothetical protein
MNNKYLITFNNNNYIWVETEEEALEIIVKNSKNIREAMKVEVIEEYQSDGFKLV